jgi:glycosyltransferase involved in cell wall biosynthesis
VDRKLRIAVWHNLPSGGGKRALYDHVKGLVERGHEVRVWVPPTADEEYLPLSSLAPVKVLHLTRHDLPKSILGKVHAVLAGPFRFVFAMLNHGQHFAAEMKDYQPDIVFFGPCRVFFAPLPLIVLAKLDPPLKTCLYLQEPNRGLYEAAPDLVWIRKSTWIKREQTYAKTFSTLERQAAQSASRILVNSRFSRESVLRAYGLDSEVCYLGVDTEHFMPADIPKENFAVGVGAIIPAKRIEFVIEACAMAQVPKLIWIGNAADASYLDQMTMLARSKGLDLLFMTMITDEELIRLLSAALAMVYAPHLEPLGYAPLEANACGTLAIGRAEGGVRETISHGINGYLVDTPSQMADHLRELLAKPELAFAMGRVARDHVVANWSVIRANDSLESHFYSLLS